ncbi:Uma2 family endonuclease [Geminocystis sp. CENA526]|uniref:Uma2 family endonuclease n=1 Tax=Geminocystis sp. CENA526 TaxID=1355871 RepID=UPI003D6DB3B5
MVAVITKPTFTLDDFLANPPNHQEWIDGKLQETTGMTIRHSKIQAKLARLWGNFVNDSHQEGEIYTELPCKTIKQGRRPDVCYLTPELAKNYDNAPSLPQSPPLIAEIASPADSAEDLFAKANEYLASGCEEVWLVLPENEKVFIIMLDRTLVFSNNDIVTTQKVLTGFNISINDLFS